MGLILDKLLPQKGERDTYFNMTEIYDTESARCPDPEENLEKKLEEIEQRFWDESAELHRKGMVSAFTGVECAAIKIFWQTMKPRILALFKPITAEELSTMYFTCNPSVFRGEEFWIVFKKAINKHFGVDNEEEN